MNETDQREQRPGAADADTPGREPGTASPRRRWVIDGLIAGLVAAAQVGVSYGAAGVHAKATATAIAGYILLGLGGAVLALRRRYPVAVLATVLVTTLVAGQIKAHVLWLALIVAFFTAVLARKRAAAIVSLVIGYIAAIWPPWMINHGKNYPSGVFAVLLAAGLLILLSVAELIRIRSQRAVALKRSREEEVRRRASEERMRMARDLHDIVAHNISVINVQANTALHLMDRQPERARSALTTINDVSKQALVELRSVLGVLRDVDENAPRAPAPGLSRLGDLIESATATGLSVRVEEDGTVTPLPAAVDLAAYRIVQEALTNSARHSRGAQTTVRLHYGGEALDVEVTDDGVAAPATRTPAPANGSGNGIAGMTERAISVGGTLRAGPRPGGGFSVRARLPLPAPGD